MRESNSAGPRAGLTVRTRPGRTIRTWAGPIAAVVAVAAALVAPAAGHASPGSGPTAIVSVGDSFISGEAGRWQGNATNAGTSRSGTDRAWTPTPWGGYYARERVYPLSSSPNGCHRSDVAEIRSAAVAVDEKINLACSGAETVNVWRAAEGGRPFKGEPPQADQLTAVARRNDVKVVVLSIGGNDIGFAGIIGACVLNWVLTPSWAPNYCNDEQQALVNRRMPVAVANMGKAVDEVRAAMAEAGYDRHDYRFVMQSYPSPVGRGADNRYPQSGWRRLDTGGCPFWNRDFDWARDSLVSQIADNVRAVALGRGLQFLDNRDMLDGRELCGRTTSHATPHDPPSGSRSEWARFLRLGQGDIYESFHPNSYAQRGLGRCLGLLVRRHGRAYACRNTPGQGPEGNWLRALHGAVPATAASRRKARPRALEPVLVPRLPRWATQRRGRPRR